MLIYLHRANEILSPLFQTYKAVDDPLSRLIRKELDVARSHIKRQRREFGAAFSAALKASAAAEKSEKSA